MIIPDYEVKVSASSFPAYMRPSELAAILRLKPKTLAEHRSRGTGPEFLKPPGSRSVIYSREAVEAWLSQGRRTSTVEAA